MQALDGEPLRLDELVVVLVVEPVSAISAPRDVDDFLDEALHVVVALGRVHRARLSAPLRDLVRPQPSRLRQRKMC